MLKKGKLTLGVETLRRRPREERAASPTRAARRLRLLLPKVGSRRR